MDNKMGTRIGELRRLHNMSQDNLAEALDISVGFMGLIERNQRGTTLKNIEKLCAIFNVTADYLVFGNNGSNNDTYRGSFLAPFENERRFVIEAAIFIIPYRFSERDLNLLLQAIGIHAKYLEQIKKQSVPLGE